MWQEIIYPVAFVLLVLLPAPLLGNYLYRVFEGKSRWLAPVERATLACCGTDGREQDWKSYALSLLAFNGAGFGLLFLILLAQGLLPLNPQQLPGLNWQLAFNTAVSFMTNTNWQAYSGEASLSYFSQMVGLTTQNFVSAATGAAVAIALFRGIARQQTTHLGNFWQDLVRFCLYVLLPMALILALLLVWQGVPQSLSAYLPFHALEGQEQLLPLGPAASQIAIKQLGSNGGGFFGVNSAHPFENPTALSNWLEMVALLTLAAAMVCTLGRYVKDLAHSRAILVAMTLMMVIGLFVSITQELKPDPALARLTTDASSMAGNWEGKESRFGPLLSSIWEVATTSASNGSVNAMHDSFTPLGGMVGMMLFVLLTVFLCGLMVGRTPTYLGKRLGITEMKWVVASMLVMPVGVLVIGGITLLMPDSATVIGHDGPHGLSRLIYAYASAAGNNGSAFAGLAAADSWQCIAIGLAMLLGRFGYIIPVLAIAGQLARAPRQERSEGDFPVSGPLFITLLIVTVLLMGGLSFLPVLALGPVAEHLSLLGGAF
ncbi:potassium-transporting ATPase subunit KdpA [Aeromonas enteropelogenes]|uniref:potassium-transporting ATPase subunit KdpA n=1 Tax=Aeromonas enteropelogenes TaxID=29489 RepID=UPI003B9F6FE1